jgi:hypothetical protein
MTLNNQMIDDVARRIFGERPADAKAARRCIMCKEAVDLDNLTSINRVEYEISALCPDCFDRATREIDGSYG